MQRRAFIKLVGGIAIGWPLTVSAQSERIRRVAILMGLAENDPETEQRLAIFKNEMEKLGWSEGRNFRMEVRFAPAGAQASQLAKELIALQPDVILAHSAQIAGALFKQTREIPVVFVNVSDPVGAGFIVSLARPGGNFTGCFITNRGSLASGWRCSRRLRRLWFALL